MLLIKLNFRGEVLSQDLKHFPRHASKGFDVLRNLGSSFMEDTEVAGSEMKHRKRKRKLRSTSKERLK